MKRLKSHFAEYKTSMAAYEMAHKSCLNWLRDTLDQVKACDDDGQITARIDALSVSIIHAQ